MQKLEAKKYYDAIRFFGRAQSRFVTQEYRRELLLTLAGLSHAYQGSGLYWAARNCSLAAVERCFAYFHEGGEFISPLFSAVKELFYAELRLGRIPQCLSCSELLDLLSSQIASISKSAEKWLEQRDFDGSLFGFLFLSSSIEQLKQLETLPDVLENLQLLMPKVALLYALGHKEKIHDEGFPADRYGEEEIDKFIKTWYENPGRLQVPILPILIGKSGDYFLSNILGCRIVCSVEESDVAIYTAESVLGALEGFLATSASGDITPYRSEFRILVKCDDTTTDEYSIADETIDGEMHLIVKCPSKMPAHTPEQREAYRSFLQLVIAKAVQCTSVVKNLELYLEKLAGEELAFSRALLFSETDIVSENIFGNSAKLKLADWIEDNSLQRYPLLRTKSWSDGISFQQMELPEESPKVKPERGRSNLDDLPHTARRIDSVIDIPLWDKARWRGVVYIADPSATVPLIMGLGFENIEAGREIFAGLQKKIGRVDAKGLLRISMIRGVDQTSPTSYTAAVSSNLIDVSEDQLVTIVSRMCSVTPGQPGVMESFAGQVSRVGRFLLVPVKMGASLSTSDFNIDLGVQLNSMTVREAWQIGEHDPDCMAIGEDDNPIIPPDVHNAPVLELLAKRRARSKEK